MLQPCGFNSGLLPVLEHYQWAHCLSLRQAMCCQVALTPGKETLAITLNGRMVRDCFVD